MTGPEAAAEALAIWVEYRDLLVACLFLAMVTCGVVTGATLAGGR